MQLAVRTLLGACEEMRNDAQLMRAWAFEDQAETLIRCADSFQLAIEEWLNQLLTCAEAGRESGRAPSTIARWVREGELLQMGKPGRPLVSRRDLFGVDAFTDPENVTLRVVRERVD